MCIILSSCLFVTSLCPLTLLYDYCYLPCVCSSNPVLKNMWPEGKLSITEVTKRPLTAATLFKNSMIALVDKLASKVPAPILSLWVLWQL